MSVDAQGILLAADFGFLASGLVAWRKGREWHGLMAVSLLCGIGCGLAARSWLEVAVNVAWLALIGRDWWNRRGKRAARALGAKSRALINGLVERAREAAPVPVPEGAGA